MKKNMGKIDRIVRVIVAVIFLALFGTGTITGTLGLILSILGGVFVATSFMSFCPLYLPFGINSCERKEK